jgi:hypothetical protein
VCPISDEIVSLWCYRGVKVVLKGCKRAVEGVLNGC